LQRITATTTLGIGEFYGCSAHDNPVVYESTENWFPSPGTTYNRKTGIRPLQNWRKYTVDYQYLQAGHQVLLKTGYCGSSPRVDTQYDFKVLKPKYWADINLLEAVMAEELAELTPGNSDIFNRAYAALPIGFNLGAFLGELPEAITLHKSIIRGIKEFRRYEDPSAIWLTGRYGVLPLIRDIQELYEIINKPNDGGGPRIVRGRSRQGAYYSKRVSEGEASVSYNLKGSYTVDVSVDNQVQAYVVGTFARHYNYSVSPASVAWELLPLSFVVDWLYSVGTMLDSIEGMVKLNNAQASFSHLREYTVEGAAHLTVNNSYYEGQRDEIFRIVVRDKQRSVIPPPSARLPSFQFDLSLTRALDALALASVLFGKK
jgi:hypothetical protein